MPHLKNRMAVKGSDRSTLHSEKRNVVSYDDADDDDDDVLLSERLSWMSNLVTRSSNRDVPIKKRFTATMPLSVKRPFDNSSYLNRSVKKPKVALYDNHNKDKMKIILLCRGKLKCQAGMLINHF